MNWFKQPAEGQTQNDHRVVVKTQGRAKGTTLLIELTDEGWQHHGDGESVLAAEAMQEASDDLQGRQADVFDYICERWASGEFPCTTAELQDVAKCNASKVNRALRALRKRILYGRKDSLNRWSLGVVRSCCGFPTPPPWKVVKKGNKGNKPSRAR